MKRNFLKLTVIFAFVILCSCTGTRDFYVEEYPKSRVIVLTDMLNEADDSQTMVRLLMYANRMDIEGLIAVSSCHQYLGKNDPIPARNGVHPEEIEKYIGAYARVLENLKKHEDGWPEPEYLLSKVAAGPPEFGMLGVGEGKGTSGSRLINEALLADDPRPVYVCINAGASCLAQALYDLRNFVDQAKFMEVTDKLRIYDDAGQDNAGAWIARTFPHLKYQRSSGQVFNFYNETGPVTWDTVYYPGEGQAMWARENIQTGHGPLGELYPTRMRWLLPDIYSTLEGGGTSTWIGHVNRGLYVPEEMTWGGWGGRFSDEKVENLTADGQLRWAGLEGAEEPYKPFFMYPEASDKWTEPESGITFEDEGVPIYRWRRAYQNDFEARMDWCVNPLEEANHNPVAAINGDPGDGIIHYTPAQGETVVLDASDSSDPDGDGLLFRWYYYKEAGTCVGPLQIDNHETSVATVHIPEHAGGKQMHVILEVRDDSDIVPLYDYRRIVFDVTKE